MMENGNALGTKPETTSKFEKIAKACRERNVSSLIGFADSDGGLLDDELRTTAWPLLLGCTDEDNWALAGHKWQELPQHPEEEQVQKDVDRAFVYYPSDESQQSMERKRTALFNLIVKVLRCHARLHYFQGYHDIVQVFLLVLGEEAAFSAVSRVSLLRIRDYMLESLGPSTKQLQLIPAILRCADPELARHLGSTPPYFALSAVLTLYAHDVQDYSDIARLYDFILAHEPVMSIYLFAALIVSRRGELLAIDTNDHDMMLFTLSKLPQPLDLQSLIDKSLQIFQRHPPESLPGRAWYNISAYSVLKTSRQRIREQTLVEADKIFRMQSQQLAKEQRNARIINKLRANRVPILSVSVTILVGVMSYYLRRNGHDRSFWSLFWRVSEVFSRVK